MLAKEIKKEVQKDVESWLSAGNKRPHLSVILVGDNPASHTYVKNKIKAATTVGISSEVILKPSNVSQEELLDVIWKLSDDCNVSGLLVQLPLPEHINERDVCNAIAPEKDVDGFHIVNIGRLCLDQSSIIPATAAAVWEIIKRTGIQTFGKNVVVVGRSKNVGMPISMLLHTDGRHERPGGDATVTITHRYTPKELLKIHTQIADIIIVAAAVMTGFSAAPSGTLSPYTIKRNSTESQEHALYETRCPEDFASFCIHGHCFVLKSLGEPSCRCISGFTGERCEHIILSTTQVKEIEATHIAIGIGVGLLISGLIAFIWFYKEKRCKKSPPNHVI
ncbi:bifunctional methylenetetrahydrofolate dehydrogenase/cyclohydrolase 2, mitochondrial-like isoform X1 [Dendropsophus ebraccatus]|uniref:bifunctional methylenetetrahydrofolate dehydrogenase/cyclohydrolase 2, mitochondrial-like isoform X1 n=1 Tax=Dendropsophus ebraccatus TaxID=150705 RepID=UPI0038316149